MANSNQSKSKTKAKKKVNHWLIRIIVLAVLAAILSISLIFESKINYALGLTKTTEEVYSGDKIEDVVSNDGGDLNVHFVDVGQGDACVIELPDFKTMIIDAGPQSGSEALMNYISDAKIFDESDNVSDYFDYAIMTHSDEDHIGGMDEVLNKYPSRVVYRPNEQASRKGFVDPSNITSGASQPTKAYASAIEAASRATKDFTPELIVTDAKVTEQSITADCVSDCEGECTSECQASNPNFYSLTFFGPISDRFSDRNDFSPIMILEYKNKRIVLSGDAEKEAEKQFVEKLKLAKKDGVEDKYDIFDDNFTADIIKLGHHGSRTSSSPDYLSSLTTVNSVKDVKIVISCGAGNSYKHPHIEVMDRLSDMGFVGDNILRTDKNGSVALSIKKNESGDAFDLYFGADVVRVDKNTFVVGSIDLTYREIAWTIFTAVAAVILIEPLVKEFNRKKRKASRKRK